MHSEALKSPVALPTVPAGHGCHAMSAESCPSNSQYPPSWQALQLVLPVSSLKVPVLQGSHDALPGADANCPGEQVMQVAPVSCADEPAGQAAQRGEAHVLRSASSLTMEAL